MKFLTDKRANELRETSTVDRKSGHPVVQLVFVHISCCLMFLRTDSSVVINVMLMAITGVVRCWIFLLIT